MATGPYILQKSTQLCFAVRSNVNFDQINPSLLGSKLGVKFSFPDGADTLPPLINLKTLSIAVKVFCEKLRIEKNSFLVTKQNTKQQRRRLHRHYGLKTRPRENQDGLDVSEQELKRSSSEVVLLGAGGFFWSKERITDEDLVKCTERLHEVDEHTSIANEQRCKPWEKLTEEEQLSVYRRHMDNGIYEYKVFGSFLDINARSFFFTQIDTNYRKQWDQYAIKLDVIDKDPAGDCEVLHWIMKYPYPLTSRDYVFVRKSKIDMQSNKMVLMSKATSHPKCPENNTHVRVTDYGSQMVILPHRTFDENGMDFVLSYYDNPKVTIPNVCTSYATSAGIPNFINKLHLAAKKVQHKELMDAFPELSHTTGRKHLERTLKQP